jgi:hypothetical protein
MERNWKNAVVIYRGIIPVCMEELRKTRKTAVILSVTTAETGNEDLLYTSLVHYLSTKQFTFHQRPNLFMSSN